MLVNWSVIIYKLLRVMIQAENVSWKHLGVCDEAIRCGSRFQRVMVLGKRLFHCISIACSIGHVSE